MALEYDFVIVGAGAHGLATAYELGKLGGESIGVLEADQVASGASGGFGQRGVRANRRDLRELPLMREANRIWPTLHEELNGPTGYSRTGGVYLIDGPAASGFKGIEAADAYVRAQSSCGIPTVKWSADEVREVYPGISETIQGASYVATDGVASHEATTLAYRDAALQLGVQIVEDAAVTSVELDTDGRIVVLVTANCETVRVRKQVILTANAGAREIVREVSGTDLPLWTIYPQAAHLRTKAVPEIPMLTGHETRSLSVKLLDGDIMLSGGWRGELTSDGPVVSPSRLAQNVSVLQSVFPYLTDLEVLSSDASRPESATVDQIPIIGYVGPNLFVEAGWSGHGWALVPAVSKNVAISIKTNTVADCLRPFSPKRFQ